MTASWLARNRALLWRIGVEHREALVAQYMVLYGLTERPALQNIYVELIEEIQGVRFLEGPLPMDRFAQTEMERGRPVITVNNLISQMPGVKDEHGVAHVAAWHESIHILVDVERRDLPPLTDLTSGLEDSTSSPLLCAATAEHSYGWSLREQAIEAAALAASIADADLRRSPSYLKFAQLAAQGGDMGAAGWRNSPRGCWSYRHILETLHNGCATAEVPPFTPHALRRAFATDAASVLPRHTVAQAGGWQGLERLDDHYVQPRAATIREKLSRTERHLKQTVTDDGALREAARPV